MQFLIMLGLMLAAALIVYNIRKNRDRQELEARIAGRGGRLLRLARTRKGSPFADTGRGWWAWRVEWADGQGEHVAWALTTREGVKEWRE